MVETAGFLDEFKESMTSLSHLAIEYQELEFLKKKCSLLENKILCRMILFLY